jgi:polyphosphate kinase
LTANPGQAKLGLPGQPWGRDISTHPPLHGGVDTPTPNMTTTAVASSLFLNRELSWLEFNSRVLQEAEDDRTPLLERLKFLSIFSTNLDEFYMVRLAALRRQVAAGVQLAPPDGLTPHAALEAIDERIRESLERRRCLRSPDRN